MKKSFAILFFISCSIIIHAQQYYPFIEEGKTWAQLNIFSPGYPDPPYTDYGTLTYKIEGDTLENGKTWKKLFTTTGDPESGNWHQDYCLYREENKKVYRYCDPFSGEEIIYDFSIIEGDSIYIDDGRTYDYWIHVIGVDSIEVSGSMRRRIHFDEPAEVWIEGLGSTYMPFDPIYGQFIIGGGLFSLLCVHDNSGLVYQDPLYNYCHIDTTLYTSVSGNPQPEFKVGIFNNSSDKQIQVSITGPEGIFSVFELFSFAGLLVKQGAIPGNEFVINQEGIKPGIYILRLSGAENVFSRKLEISH